MIELSPRITGIRSQVGSIRLDRTQYQLVVPPIRSGGLYGQRAGLDAAGADMRHGVGLFVDAIGAEIGRIADDGVARFVRRRQRP